MKIIVANWKMNGDLELVAKFIKEINLVRTENTVVVCPPAALITSFSDFRYHIGAQNCSCEDCGAFTGENSPKLLKSLGCRYVIIGHSERRTLFNETNESVYKKWEAIVRNGMSPIVCIGETSEERSSWKETISNQLKPFIGKQIDSTIVAYEPVWSIGTGQIPEISEITDVLTFVRDLLKTNTKLLYGGSVNSKNAPSILNNADGVLVGGASLKSAEFSKIIQGAD